MAMGGISVAQINCAGELSEDYMAGGKDPHRCRVDRNWTGIKKWS